MMLSYFIRHGLFPPLITEPPAKDTGLIVVIPCYREDGLIHTLESLLACDPPACPAEVIVVINCSENDADEIKKLNLSTYGEARWFAQDHSHEKLGFHILSLELNAKDAGVGLARKAGMDEAVRRFEAAGTDHRDGIILCLDADCTCEKNYLQETERHFRLFPGTPGASLYFEHATEGNPDPRIDQGIIRYELFLRYYVNALRFAGHPYAFQTIGSSMAVRSSVYQQQGGMNRRKAGEDFYFLQKVIALGSFTGINSTCVFPSARPSARVPFGTGKAIGDWLNNKDILYYDFRIFREMKQMLDISRNFYTEKNITNLLKTLPQSINTFLEQENATCKLQEIRSHTSSPETFRQRFFRWFNGFKALKYVHYASNNFYPRTGIAGSLAKLSLFTESMPQSEKEMLKKIRCFDRKQGNTAFF